MNEETRLEIDGSFGEGGGSILRLSAGFSVLFNTPIRVKNIRANRSKPGLRLQHLMGLKSLANLTKSELSESEIGTKEITFSPNEDSKIEEELKIDVNTAASVGLLLQPLQIACMGISHPECIKIFVDGGGTLGKWAPSLNYLNKVTYKIYRLCGYKIELDIKQYGFYPKGGAKTLCKIFPPADKLNSLNLTKLGKINKIEGKIICTKTLKKPKVAERIKKAARDYISKKRDIPIEIKYGYVDSLSTGVGLSLWVNSDTNAILSTGTILGEKGISSEEVGRKAANELLTYIENKIPVDNYLSDQLIPLMAYAKGSSKIRVLEVTNHTKTNLELIKKFIDREYQIIKEDNSYIIEYL